MEFLLGVALLGGGLYLFISGDQPLLGGVLTGIGVLAFGGGLFRRRGSANEKRDDGS